MRMTGPLIYKQLLFLILGNPFSSTLGYYLVWRELCSVVSKSSFLFLNLIFFSLTNICFIPLVMDHGYPEPLSLKILSFQKSPKCPLVQLRALSCFINEELFMYSFIIFYIFLQNINQYSTEYNWLLCTPNFLNFLAN